MNADSSSVKINVFGAKPLQAQGLSFSESSKEPSYRERPSQTTACQPGYKPRWVQGKDGSWAQDGCKVEFHSALRPY